MTIPLHDDRGVAFRFAAPPARIVSLVPSDTYTLQELGVGDRLVGRTDYCLAEEVEAVGGTKNADVARILELSPDVVIANQEENRRVDIERLEAAGVPVFVSFPQTVRQGLDVARRLAQLLGVAGLVEVVGLFDELEAKLTELEAAPSDPVPTFVPIWMDPLMTVHGDTFISDVLELVGGRNVFSDRERRYPLRADLGLVPAVPTPEGRDTRYPRVTLAEVEARAPELILLPDEPHAFTPEDAAVFEALHVPAAGGGIHFCDGKDLMWYGLRALHGLDRLRRLLDEARIR